MLLREIEVDDYIIELTQDSNTFIIKVVDSENNKIFHHEYEDYEEVKVTFDRITEKMEAGSINSEDILEIFEKGSK